MKIRGGLQLGLVTMLLTGAGLVMSSAPAFAWSGQSTLNLAGGDQLQANAWACSSYWTACQWQNSALLVGYNPSYANWVQSNTTLTENGVGLSSMTISKAVTLTLTFQGTTLWRGYWRNYPAYEPGSSGTQGLDWWSLSFSSQECSSAYSPTFGTPSNVCATGEGIS